MTGVETGNDVKGPWWLAFRVIDEPVEVFRQLAARPRALVPFFLIAIAGVVFAFGTPESVLRGQAERTADMLAERAPERFTEEQRLEMLENAASTVRRATMAGSVIAAQAVSLLVVAGVLLLVFNAYGSEPMRYKDELAITTHAFIPQLLGIVLLVLLARFAGLEEMQLSLGFLFKEGFLHDLGVQFTPFGAWNIVLLGLGNQIRTGAKSLTGPLGIVVTLWILVNLGFAALSSVFGGLAG
jgi:hypothetical protein